MSNITNLEQSFRVLVETDIGQAKIAIRKAQAIVELAEGHDSPYDSLSEPPKANVNIINDNNEEAKAERFSYDDKTVDTKTAESMRLSLGKVPVSTIYTVFIIDVLSTINRGRKKSTILEFLNAASLPMTKNALTTKMNRLKKKGLVYWDKGNQPGEPEIEVTDTGIAFLQAQLSTGLRSAELAVFKDAKRKIGKMIANNSAP